MVYQAAWLTMCHQHTEGIGAVSFLSCYRTVPQTPSQHCGGHGSKCTCAGLSLVPSGLHNLAALAANGLTTPSPNLLFCPGLSRLLCHAGCSPASAAAPISPARLLPAARPRLPRRQQRLPLASRRARDSQQFLHAGKLHARTEAVHVVSARGLMVNGH